MQTTLVGRKDELAALSSWLEEARAGSARVVLLSGEPGIGKTRLAAELSSMAALDAVKVAWGRGTEQEGPPPFWPWRQVLDRLGRGDVLNAGTHAEPEVERFTRFEEVTSVLATAAADSGVLVVLEDIHQVDLASLSLLAHVTDSMRGRVLLVASHRSSPADHVEGFAAVVDQLQRSPITRRIELSGLDHAAVAELLGLGPQDPVVAGVARRGGGNPLLVGELARHLGAGHDMSSVPSSVRDTVRVRLAARSPLCAHTLTVASVVGRDFDAGLVATATDAPAITVLEAIEEASAAGLVEPADRPGCYRFVHVLVRDAIEASLGASALPLVHQQVAKAIEAHDGTGDEVLADLARHWSAAAALGDREVAARWCELAAEAADRRTAWEESSRLYDRAAELTKPDTEPELRYRRLLGSARARMHCDEIAAAVDRSMAAAETARRLQRPELLAEACLIGEGRAGGPELLTQLDALAEEALAALGPDDHSLRARLLGQLTTTAFYLDPAAVEPRSMQALTEANIADDPLAILAATRARQMCLIEPRYAEERLELAARLGAAGRALGRSTVTQWESIWRMDALLELGRLADARRELVELRRRVAAVGLPMSRWHLARFQAMLAHTAGRFQEAIGWSEQARDLFSALEDERGAQAIHLSFLLEVQRHTGYDEDIARQVLAFDYHEAPPFLGDLPALAPIQALVGIGDLDRARARYAQLAPPESWDSPPFLRFTMTVLRVDLATAIGRLDDLPGLLDVLEHHRGLHAGPTAGGGAYLGCAELWLGIARAALGQHDAAVTALRHALDVSLQARTPPITVQSAAELADALVARGEAGDRGEARSLATAWRPEAAALRMAPWTARFDRILATATPSEDCPLSVREMEVAELIALGHTNHQIASALFVSARTAQNHVQHILTKLGAHNRTQIATWFNARRDAQQKG